MFASVAQALKKDQQRLIDEKNEVCQLRPKWQDDWEPLRSAGGRAGDERVAKFLWLLDNMGYVRNEDQVEFHKQLFLASIDRFYGAAWSTEMHRVMKIYKIKEIQRHVIMLARRRLGKTVAVCLFQAAMMICIGGEVSIVLATNQRISLMIMEAVIKMLETQPETRGRFKKSGERLMYSQKEVVDELFTVKYLLEEDTAFEQGRDKNISTLLCYPGSQSKRKLLFIKSYRHYSSVLFACFSFRSS